MNWQVLFPLESEEKSIEEYVRLVREKIVDAKVIMVELVGLAWGRKTHLGLNLNEEPMKGIDAHDQPTPIVKLSQAREYTQLLSNFVVEHPSEILVMVVTNMKSFMNKLNMMSMSNIKKTPSKTIDSYFRSVIYGEDIIMGLYFFKLHFGVIM